MFVLGASFDSVEDNAAFARKYDFNFPLLCDIERTLGMAYGACNNPQARHAARISVLIDESGKIARIYTQVNPRDHAGQSARRPNQSLAERREGFGRQFVVRRQEFGVLNRLRLGHSGPIVGLWMAPDLLHA